MNQEELLSRKTSFAQDAHYNTDWSTTFIGAIFCYYQSLLRALSYTLWQASKWWIFIQ